MLVSIGLKDTSSKLLVGGRGQAEMSFSLKYKARFQECDPEDAGRFNRVIALILECDLRDAKTKEEIATSRLEVHSGYVGDGSAEELIDVIAGIYALYATAREYMTNTFSAMGLRNVNIPWGIATRIAADVANDIAETMSSGKAPDGHETVGSVEKKPKKKAATRRVGKDVV